MAGLLLSTYDQPMTHVDVTVCLQVIGARVLLIASIILNAPLNVTLVALAQVSTWHC
jgi:hypothetical protein